MLTTNTAMVGIGGVLWLDRFMAKFESKTTTQGFTKIILEEDASIGTYIYVYESQHSKGPERDHLQDDTATGQEVCLDDYGVPLTSG